MGLFSTFVFVFAIVFVFVFVGEIKRKNFDDSLVTVTVADEWLWEDQKYPCRRRQNPINKVPQRLEGALDCD